MTFKEHVEACKELLKKHPELADKEAVYSVDDEGNAFCKVIFSPSPGEHTPDRSFKTKQDDDKNYVINKNTNAVCIN